MIKFEDIHDENTYEFNNRNVISYSQMSTFYQCPHKWKTRYIDKIKDDKKTIHLIFGIALHETVQIYLYTLYKYSTKKANEINIDFLLHTNMRKQLKLVEKGKLDIKKGDLFKYYNNGVEAIKYFINNRVKYLPKKGYELVGIETPLIQENINEKNIDLIQYLDVVLKNKKENRYLIIDIKTAKKGWNKYHKNDIIKRSQVLLYKKYYAKKMNIDLSSIDVKFLIFRHQTSEIKTDSYIFNTKYIQEYVPPSGKTSMNIITQKLNDFIEYCFNEDGTYKTEQKYDAIETKLCDYCFYNTEQLCPTKNRISR